MMSVRGSIGVESGESDEYPVRNQQDALNPASPHVSMSTRLSDETTAYQLDLPSMIR